MYVFECLCAHKIECVSAFQVFDYYSHEMEPEYPVKQVILLSGVQYIIIPAVNIADRQCLNKEAFHKFLLR